MADEVVITDKSTTMEVFSWAKKIVSEENAKKFVDAQVDGANLLLWSNEPKEKLEGKCEKIGIPFGQVSNLASEIKKLNKMTTVSINKELEEKDKIIQSYGKRKYMNLEAYAKALKKNEDKYPESDLDMKTILCLQDNQYTYQEVLYTSENSVVVKVRSKNQDFAIKLLKDINEARTEENTLRLLESSHIMKLRDTFELHTKYKYALVFDLLEDAITFEPISSEELQIFMLQLLQAVQFCHSKGIVHRDIKPENIFYRRENGSIHVVLGDFGLSCPVDSNNLFDGAGTVHYQAPECFSSIRDMDLNKVDEWSCGVVFAQLYLNRRLLFPAKHQSEIRSKLQNFDASKILTSNKDVDDLIIKLLAKSPKERITVDKALEHKYFANISVP